MITTYTVVFQNKIKYKITSKAYLVMLLLNLLLMLFLIGLENLST
jgi:hypothetical protein